MTRTKGLRLFALALCLLMLLGAAVPALAASVSYYGKVLADGTKVYAAADKLTVIGTFKKGDIVGIEAQVSASNVYVVRTTSTGLTTGYMEKSAVSLVTGGTLASMTPASGTSASSTGTITGVTSYANMRDKASSSGKVIAKPTKGATVTILGTSGDYYQVSYDGKNGYVAKQYVTVSSAADTAPAETTTGTTTKAVSLTTKAGSGSTVKSLSKGATITILGESGNYYQASYSGKTGYVAKSAVQVTGTTTTTGGTGTDTGAITVGTGKIKVEPYQSTPTATVKSKLASAQKANSEVIGYISVNGTNISHPILYHKGDVHFYATHSATKASSSSGAIYAFYKDMVRNNTITGHNMRQSGTMFHQLHYLQEKTLGYTVHQTTDSGAKKGSLTSIPSLTTAANRIWDVNLFGYNKWEVFAMYETPATEPASTLKNNINPLSSYTPAQVKTWIAYQKGRSEYKFNTAVSTDDIFLTVYTCGNNFDYATAQSRLYFFLKAVK